MARTPSLDAHNRVLEAALELFVEKGIEATSMDALAAASGVSKATIYKHWPEGKEPLLMELMLLVVGIEGPVDEENTGNLFTDLAKVLNNKPRHARPEDQKRLMPQMVAYSATHQEFGNAWRSRVMEEPRRRIRRILTEAMARGRVAADLDMELSFAMLLGPLMYRHIFGRGQNWIGRPKQESDADVPAALSDPVELGNSVAEAFCRAYEVGDGWRVRFE